MPKGEYLGSGSDPTKEDLPILDSATEKLDKERREKKRHEQEVFLKKQDKELRKRIKEAANLQDVLGALESCGKKSLAENIIETVRDLKELIKEKKELKENADDIRYTLEHVLEEKELFGGSSYNIGDPYLHKKIIYQLKEFIKDELRDLT